MRWGEDEVPHTRIAYSLVTMSKIREAIASKQVYPSIAFDGNDFVPLCRGAGEYSYLSYSTSTKDLLL